MKHSDTPYPFVHPGPFTHPHPDTQLIHTPLTYKYTPLRLFAFFSVSLSQLQTFNTEALKLSVQGITLVAASGDDGVAGFEARDNSANCDYIPQVGPLCHWNYIYYPPYPYNCDYVPQVTVIPLV